MRKASAALALLLALSMTACGSSGSGGDKGQDTTAQAGGEQAQNGESTSGGQGEKTELTLWMGSWWEGSAPTIKAEFEKAYPQYTLTIDCLPVNGYFDNAATSILSGSPPDILDIDITQISSFVTKGLLTDITDSVGKGLKKDDFISSCWNASNYQGKMYGMPSRGSAGLYFYNKDMFDKAGLEYPTNDWTYDDMLEMAKKLTVAGETYGVGIAGDPSDQGNFFTCFAPMLWYFGGEFFDEEYTKCTLDSPEAIEAITFWSELYTKHKVCPEGSLNYTIARDVIPMLNQGQVAMLPSGSGALATFDKNPDLHYGVVQYPKGLSRAGGWTLTIPSTAKNPDKAVDFLKWFAKPEVQALVCTATEPSNKAAWEMSELWNTPQNQEFMKSANSGKTLPAVGCWSEAAKIIMTEMQKVLQQQMTPEEGAKSVVEQINPLLLQ